MVPLLFSDGLRLGFRACVIEASTSWWWEGPRENPCLLSCYKWMMILLIRISRQSLGWQLSLSFQDRMCRLSLQCLHILFRMYCVLYVYLFLWLPLALSPDLVLLHAFAWSLLRSVLIRWPNLCICCLQIYSMHDKILNIFLISLLCSLSSLVTSAARFQTFHSHVIFFLICEDVRGQKWVLSLRSAMLSGVAGKGSEGEVRPRQH